MDTIIKNFDLADKLIEFLTINHDKLYTIQQIHSAFYDTYDEFKNLELKKDLIDKLKVTFFSIEGEYNNVYRIVKDNKHYLIWSLRKKEEVMNDIQKESPKTYEIIDNKEIDTDLENYVNMFSKNDYVNYIQLSIKMKNLSFMHETNYLDGVNNPVHILVLNNDFETLKILDSMVPINYEVVNKEGKDCVALAFENKNIEIYDFLMKIRIKLKDAKIAEIVKINETLKDGQKKNYDQINELTKKNQELTKKINEKFPYWFFILFLLSAYFGMK